MAPVDPKTVTEGSVLLNVDGAPASRVPAFWQRIRENRETMTIVACGMFMVCSATMLIVNKVVVKHFATPVLVVLAQNTMVRFGSRADCTHMSAALASLTPSRPNRRRHPPPPKAEPVSAGPRVARGQVAARRRVRGLPSQRGRWPHHRAPSLRAALVGVEYTVRAGWGGWTGREGSEDWMVAVADIARGAHELAGERGERGARERERAGSGERRGRAGRADDASTTGVLREYSSRHLLAYFTDVTPAMSVTCGMYR